jgi:LuxR family quorum-sensing system transcriptional regulator CciR
MRGNREAVADPPAPGRFEHGLVPDRQHHHFRNSRPNKADAGEIACAVDGIDPAKRLLIEPFSPSGGIIVKPDGAARATHIDMVREREIAKTKVGGDLADRFGQLGFDYYALLHHDSLVRRSGLMRLVRYPQGWSDEFDRFGFARDDPVHLACSRVNTGFCWDETSSIIELTDRHRAIFAQSHRFGLGPGFTVPANIPGEPRGSCSFAVRSGKALPVRHLRCAELVGAHAFRTARRFCGIYGPARAPHLSRRELQCVELVAQGKSDFEIAIILGISCETARQYVKRARSAYDVVSRTQLAVRALQDGRVVLE